MNQGSQVKVDSVNERIDEDQNRIGRTTILNLNHTNKEQWCKSIATDATKNSVTIIKDVDNSVPQSDDKTHPPGAQSTSGICTSLPTKQTTVHIGDEVVTDQPHSLDIDSKPNAVPWKLVDTGPGYRSNDEVHSGGYCSGLRECCSCSDINCTAQDCLDCLECFGVSLS